LCKRVGIPGILVDLTNVIQAENKKGHHHSHGNQRQWKKTYKTNVHSIETNAHHKAVIMHIGLVWSHVGEMHY